MAFKLVVLSCLLAFVHSGAVPAAIAAGPVSYAAPVAARLEQFDSVPQYRFGYEVGDSLTGDYKTQSEQRDGDVVRGQYSLVESDGTRRIVDYEADPIRGFNAVVRNEPLLAAAPAVAEPAVVSARIAAAAPVVAQPAPPAPVFARYAAPAAVAAPVPVFARYAAGPVVAQYAPAPAVARYATPVAAAYRAAYAPPAAAAAYATYPAAAYATYPAAPAAPFTAAYGSPFAAYTASLTAYAAPGARAFNAIRGAPAKLVEPVAAVYGAP